MREMKDSGIEWIGEIPVDWEVIKNKYLLSLLYSGGTPSVSNNEFYCFEGGTPFVSISDMSTVDYVLSTQKRLTDSGLKDKNLKILPIGTILYSIYATVGAVSELKIEAAISQAMLALQVNSKVDKTFYKYNLTAMKDYIFSNANGNTQFNLNAEKVKNFYLVLPNIETQHRIADYLDRKCSQIDAIIAQQQEVIEKLKAYKLSVITEAVTKGLDPDVPMKDSGIPWVGKICNHYALSRVGAFCFVTKLAGFEYTDIMSSAISDTGEVPIVRAQNVRMFNFNDNIDEYIRLDVSQKLDRCALNKKCLLITFIGAGIGDVCVFSKTMRYHLAPNVAKIEIRDDYKTILDEEYLMFYLGSLAGKGEISKISKASAQPSLSMGTIRGITIVVPPIDEQRKISEYLSKKFIFIDKVVRGKESIIENLFAYKNSLIYEVITGKKEV